MNNDIDYDRVPAHMKKYDPRTLRSMGFVKSSASMFDVKRIEREFVNGLKYSNYETLIGKATP